MISPFQMNHVGFPCLAPKRFLIRDPQETKFRIDHLLHTRLHPAFEGELSEIEPGLWAGDFTALTAPGDYQIAVGETRSRFFVIHDRAYDMAERLMLGYFTMQRCGSPLGWAGMCHQEDGYVAETGERVNLTGGYHQSADLRKSPGGVSIGVLALMHWAALRHPLWGRGLIEDELRWACDYYLKQIQPNGCMYNTLNAPLGWDGRLFYAEGAPAHCQWNVITILAMGARLLKGDAAYAADLLKTARRAWRYMNRADRSPEHYRHPDVLPRGMDADNFFYSSFRDSTSDLCGRLSAAVALYRADGDDAWEAVIAETANRLCGRQITGDPRENPVAGDFRMAEDDLCLFNCGATYGWIGGGVLSLCEALDALPFAGDRAVWLKAVENYADMTARFSRRDAHLLPPSIGSESNMLVPTGHPAPGRAPQHIGDTFKNAAEAGYIENAAG